MNTLDWMLFFILGELLPAHYEAGLSEKVQAQPLLEFGEVLQNNNKLRWGLFTKLTPLLFLPARYRDEQ